MLPMRIDPIPKNEIRHRLGLKDDGASTLSIGAGPNMAYNLANEHEVLCPISGAHQGVLCTAILPSSSSSQSSPSPWTVAGENADSVADNHELVSQAILSGSLAASVRSRPQDGNSVYYLPFIITLVESLMADEIESLDLGEMVFNSAGLETNEILMDWENGEAYDSDSDSVFLYACNTQQDQSSATSDVYVLPQDKKGKIWKFSVEFKVATLNLGAIPSFGERDSTTPLRPDVWLKDDSY